MPRALISVIIRTYNQAGLLEKALKSALNQTLAPDEIIIVDDASTDSTKDLVTFYAAQDSCIKYLRLSTNRGMYFTGQLGFEESKGHYIAFLDHDDLWLPNHLEKCVAAFNKQPSPVLVFSRYGLIDSQGEHLVSVVQESRVSLTRPETFLFKKVIATPTRSVYTRQAVVDMGGIRPVVWDWVYPTLLAAKYPGGIVRIPDRTVLFRLHGAQSYSQPQKLLDALLQSTDYIFENLSADFQRLKPRTVAMNMLQAAAIFWQGGRTGEAWKCLAVALKTDPYCVTRSEFGTAVLRLMVHPTIAKRVRQWKRTFQRWHSAGSLPHIDSSQAPSFQNNQRRSPSPK